jgi:predicted nucleic acid-binding protein
VANSFFDSSAIVKRYMNEAGTTWVNNFVSPAARNRVLLARITGVEVVSAIARRGRSGALPLSVIATLLQRFRQEFIQVYRIVAVTPRVLATAMNVAEKYALRGYDAVQLAAALQIHVRLKVPLLFVSADGALNHAAAAEGLSVENPNHYP